MTTACTRRGPLAEPEADSVDVTIVIPVFNKCELTRACLESLDRHTTRQLDWEAIVVDNASSDGTPEYLETASRTFGWLRGLRNEVNEGFARASNQGARAGRGRAVLFLNNDTVALDGWLEPLYRTLYCDDRIAAVGSKLLFPDGTIQHAGVYIADHRGQGDPFVGMHNHFGRPAEEPDARRRRVYPALTGACLLVRRGAYNAVGGLDEGFWNGYEDVDFCLTLASQGWLCVYEPESVLIHHESQSGPERFRRAIDNVRRLHAKWLGRRKPNYIIHEDHRIEPVCRDGLWDLPLPAGCTFERVLEQVRTSVVSEHKLSSPQSSPIESGSQDKAAATIRKESERYNVVVVEPDGYEHSGAFLEVAELLVHSLESLGRHARLQKNHLDSGATNVLLGYHLLPSAGNLRLVRHILVQLEQLSEREGWFRPHHLEVLRSADAVWDYALENVEFLRGRGLTNVCHLPMGYHERLRRIVRRSQDIDVLFYGSLNARRRAILEEVGRLCRLECLTGVYGCQRDEYVSRAKIVLNLHYYDAEVLEQARIAYLLNNRCFVLSEASRDNPFGDSLTTCRADEMAERVRHYLNHPRERYERAKAGFEAFRQRPMTTYLQPILEAYEGRLRGLTDRTLTA